MTGARIKTAKLGNQPPITVNVDSWSTEEGWDPFQQVETVEEMSAPGLDGVRWRRVGARDTTFTAVSVESVKNYDKALSSAVNYRKLQGRICQITTDRGGYTITVMVLGCRPSCSTGKVSDTAKSTNTGLIDCEWTLIQAAPGSRLPS